MGSAAGGSHFVIVINRNQASAKDAPSSETFNSRKKASSIIQGLDLEVMVVLQRQKEQACTKKAVQCTLRPTA